jgi:hypothetical protein
MAVSRRRIEVGALVKMIGEKFRKVEENPPMKADSYLRTSAFADLCPREEVLCSKLGTVRRREYDADIMLTFAHGRGLHNILQNEVLPTIGVLLGKWSCQHCGQHYEGAAEGPIEKQVILRPLQCLKCEKSEFLFHELFFEDKALNIGGHPDGFLKIPERPDLGILEAKSISPRGAYEIKGTPKMSHALQAMIYMWLSGLKWAKILYWNKGLFGRNALTEHFLEYDEDTVEGIKETIFGMRNGILTGDLPERICETKHCERAQECSSAEVCFKLEGKIPDGYQPTT